MFEILLLTFGVSHGAYLTFSLVRKVGSHKANTPLAACIGCLTSILMLALLDETNLVSDKSGIHLLQQPLLLCIAPFLFFYVKRITSTHFVFFSWRHFSPSIVVALVNLIFLSTIWLGVNNQTWHYFYQVFLEQGVTLFALLQVGCYIAASWQSLKNHKNNIKQQFSTLDKINLAWLSKLILALMAVYFVWLVEEAQEQIVIFCLDYGIGFNCSAPWIYQEKAIYYSELGLVILFYLISYFGLKQPEIFAATQDEKSLPSAKKYENSALDESMALQVFNDVSQLITEQQWFLAPELTLTELASLTGYSRHQLSQAINQSSQNNFFTYINTLRIEFAKQLISVEPNKSVLDVSLASGFNSRSAFYNAFKKQTGATPSQFKSTLSTN